MLAMAAMLFSGGRGKDGSVWTDNSASPNGGNQDSSTVEATAPSPSGSEGNPSGSGIPAAGVSTTCHACTTGRISRSVTCQGCHKTFHWTCMGFYEHKYQRPGPNWRCKDCKIVEPPSPAAAGGGAASPAEPVQEVQSPESGNSIDVGEETPVSTTPPKMVPPVAAVQSETAGVVTAVREALTAVGTVTGSAPAPTGPPAGTTALAAAVPSPMGEHICPICRKGVGRFRNVECSVCRMPSHAGCVNVRGAETPKSWVCRDCKPDAHATAGTIPKDATAAVTSRPSVAAQTVSRACLAREGLNARLLLILV